MPVDYLAPAVEDRAVAVPRIRAAADTIAHRPSRARWSPRNSPPHRAPVRQGRRRQRRQQPAASRPPQCRLTNQLPLAW